MSNQPQGSTNDVPTAAQHAIKLLSAGKTELALEQAEVVLRQYPNELNCQFVVAAVRRSQRDYDSALDILLGLVERAPDYALAHQELGFTYSDTGAIAQGIAALRRAVELQPKLATSWKLLGELLLANGQEQAASDAFNQGFMLTASDPVIAEANALFIAGKIGKAERLCRDFLKQHPTNVNAIRLLAEVGIQLGVYEEAEKLLERCLELAPDFRSARLNYANVLTKRNKLEQALAQVDYLLQEEPDKPSLLVLQAANYVKMGDYDRALPAYKHLLENHKPRAAIALSYGHGLKTVGQQAPAIDAYRQATQIQPGFGDAWWSMANLKTFRFEDADLEVMRRESRAEGNSLEDRFHLCFALGKALEDRNEYAESFRYYDLGNTIKMRLEGYSADETSATVANLITGCGTEVVSAPTGSGCQAPDPIFVVGLPRSGSTLLEQILASHSLVDGTKELPDILALARRLGGKRKKEDVSRYPAILAELSDQQFRELGEEYLERTRIQRGNAPFFVDKMPNNFFHLGLMNRMMPNAKFIDARRHPMAACFSGFTQLFAKGQPFTYGLVNVGRYYKDYVTMMDHWDAVMPGRVLRIQYEEVVADTETQVRRLLDYCRLPWEDACLNFHETERAVRTASSEQVRQPIYSSGLEHWRNFEADLDKLKAALGPVLERYPVD
jgi:tetratricopeptide (TPR) repeat protein